MAYSLIDTHCHLCFRAFDSTWQETVNRARAAGVGMICVGAARETSAKSIAIAQKTDGVFAAVGLHPTHAEDEEFAYEWFAEAAQRAKVVAIGETGIDHYHLDEKRKAIILKKQEDLLRRHLLLAQENKLPVILHSRDGREEQGGQAYEHLYQIIKDFGYFNCVLHCYGGGWPTAEKFLKLGLMISFTGIISFHNAGDNLKEVSRQIPLERMMIETDSPYLAPEPYRGKQSEPAYIERVARAIAEIRGVSFEEIAEKTTRNAIKFFKLNNK